MTAAAIQAQLVDVRNLGTEKCIKLTLHVPAEQAMQVLECFGWATAVNPVPVALARLEVMPAEQLPKEQSNRTTDTPPRPVKASGGAKSWHEMAPAQQAGILSNDKSFQKFCGARNTETAAEWIRQTCGVKSRSEIIAGDKSNDYFLDIVAKYRAWMREPEVVGS